MFNNEYLESLFEKYGSGLVKNHSKEELEQESESSLAAFLDRLHIKLKENNLHPVIGMSPCTDFYVSETIMIRYHLNCSVELDFSDGSDSYIGPALTVSELEEFSYRLIEALKEQDLQNNCFLENLDLLLSNSDLILKTKAFAGISVPMLWHSVNSKSPVNLGKALWFYTHNMFVYEDSSESCCRKRYGIDVLYSPLTGAVSCKAICPVCKKTKLYESEDDGLFNFTDNNESSLVSSAKSSLKITELVKLFKISYFGGRISVKNCKDRKCPECNAECSEIKAESSDETWRGLCGREISYLICPECGKVLNISYCMG